MAQPRQAGDARDACRPGADAGSTRTETWRDDYIFPNESPVALFDPQPGLTSCKLGGSTLLNSVTENIGIYGQVGYEWADTTDVSTGGFKADIDYSSLVLSVGVQVRF